MGERTPRPAGADCGVIMNWEEWAEYSEDEQNWRDHEEKGLLKAEYVNDFILRLWFEEENDVSIYELDFRTLFVDRNPGGVFGALKNQHRFRVVKGDYALVWLDPQTGQYNEQAIDIAPECVRFFAERYGRAIKTVGGQSQQQMMAA